MRHIGTEILAAVLTTACAAGCGSSSGEGRGAAAHGGRMALPADRYCHRRHSLSSLENTCRKLSTSGPLWMVIATVSTHDRRSPAAGGTRSYTRLSSRDPKR